MWPNKVHPHRHSATARQTFLTSIKGSLAGSQLFRPSSMLSFAAAIFWAETLVFLRTGNAHIKQNVRVSHSHAATCHPCVMHPVGASRKSLTTTEAERPLDCDSLFCLGLIVHSGLSRHLGVAETARRRRPRHVGRRLILLVPRRRKKIHKLRDPTVGQLGWALGYILEAGERRQRLE